MAVGTSEDLPNLPFVPFLPRPGGGRTTMAATDGQTLQRFVHEPGSCGEGAGHVDGERKTMGWRRCH